MSIHLHRAIEPGILGLTPDGDLAMHQSGPTGRVTDRYIGGRRRVTTVISAQLLALNATPVEVMPAAPAGYAWVLQRVALHKPAGTAYAGVAAGEDLVVKYGSGAQVSSVIETTGFLDQTTVQYRYAGPPASTGATAADVTPVAAAALVLHLLVGEITTGDSPLYVEVIADMLQVAFTQ